MGNPLPIVCPVGVWTKVATAATFGAVEILDTKAYYRRTSRLTGQTAPLDNEIEDALDLHMPGHPIRSSDAIDVYIMAVGKSGKVVVTL